MASEIIALEKSRNNQHFAFYYAIPAGTRIEIGGTGTTGMYPVMSPTSGMNDELLMVLTTAEKDALDAGEAVVKMVSLAMLPNWTPADVLDNAQQLYAAYAGTALADYESRYEYIGLRFDKE